MELGEKLRLARQEAGLSQRQLCGEEITRNMLSQIEHGTARPSMTTLRYLAARLEKPVSYFLEEDAVTSPNQKVMADARRCYDAGEYEKVVEILESYRTPDETFDREKGLLEALTLLALAETAISDTRFPYAVELLERAGEMTKHSAYLAPELERRRLLLLGRIPGQSAAACTQLPSLDEELLLRAEAAFASGDAERAAKLLQAAQNREAPQWNLLRGEICMKQGDYAAAVRCFHKAETEHPVKTARYLEACYRELGDFKQAYFYACKQR